MIGSQKTKRDIVFPPLERQRVPLPASCLTLLVVTGSPESLGSPNLPSPFPVNKSPSLADFTSYGATFSSPFLNDLTPSPLAWIIIQEL